MREFIRVMKALSDPNRVKALKALQHKELCVCELQPLLGISQPTVSKHMKIMEDAGLVSKRKEGQWAYYSLSQGEQSEYASGMLAAMHGWLNNDTEIQQLLRKVALSVRLSDQASVGTER